MGDYKLDFYTHFYADAIFRDQSKTVGWVGGGGVVYL